MNKYIWAYSMDGSVIFVYIVYQPRFSSYHKLKAIKCWSTGGFSNPQKVAEDFIERLKELEEQ